MRPSYMRWWAFMHGDFGVVGSQHASYTKGEPPWYAHDMWQEDLDTIVTSRTTARRSSMTFSSMRVGQ